MSADIPSQRRKSIDDAEWQTRVDLAACYRLIALLGLDDMIYNHISARVPGKQDEFLINPYGLLFEEITASSLVKINLQGEKLEQSPYDVNVAGFVIHGAIHAARHDAMCVLHTHSDASTAVSTQQNGLLPLSQFAMRFYRRQAFHDYEGVAIDMDEQSRLVSDLGECPVMLMRNHGVLVLGRTPGEAFMLLYYFERAARIQLDIQATSATAGAMVLPSPAVCEKAALQFWEQQGDILINGEREWPALLRKLERDCPDYHH
ncbi:class II aldolase/adducin family protein [Halomonas sp. QX-2]|jgi:ribulose-5-phosphate 4-epimerase/fuculose-1-phosphate aldolase|uniref:Class II aldolase/adducin family protein n=1 Tax=Vreelandella sedimenti TaxID=2729618 RepID=A0A7Z0SLN6_9GAMM|nr:MULTISPECIES: class II aldolase/adducin family protein [Halomonas]NYT71900.1 class II aldolase/adducin family protein [Halomonas sedimenti]|tara:strand:+ start:132863 stop:133645 length:783 start_codon:yes stop_codon:yes gene_type:complete